MIYMLENLIGVVLPVIIHILELMGVLIICFGAIRSIVTYFKMQFLPTKGRRLSDSQRSGNVKVMLGTSLELGLEYKIGAEIIKTLLIRDMSEIWILASVLVLRAMLFVLIHFEMRAEINKSKDEQRESD
jgi:uncharacterized membrane protein